MIKKILYLSLILIVILGIGTTCFASATMTSEMAENILNFVSQNLDSALDTNTSYLNYIDLAKTYISTIKSGDFANNFNKRFDSLINYDGEYSLKNITLVSSFSYDSSSLWCYFDFFLSNNGYHEDLPYLLIKEGEGTVSYGQYFVRESLNENRINGVRIVYRRNSSAIFGNLAANWVSSYTLTKDFYNIDDNGVIYINSVLALDGSQTIYFKGLNDIEASPYICGNSLTSIEFPGSGDLESSLPYFITTPSGECSSEEDFIVDIYSDFDLNIDDYYLALTQYDANDNPEFSHAIKNSTIWLGERKDNIYSINLNNYYTFSDNKKYKVLLISSSDGELDSSDFFWINSSFWVPNYPQVIEYPYGVWNGGPLKYKCLFKFEEYGVDVNSCWMRFDKYEIVSGDMVYVNSLKFYPFITENFDFETSTYSFDALWANKDNFFDSEGVYVYYPYLESNWGNGLYPDYSYKCLYFFTPLARLAIMGENPDDYKDAEIGDLFDFLTNFLTTNFSFIDKIKNSIFSFEDIMSGVVPAPSLSINVKETKYTTARSIKILDLSWYLPYKEYGDLILTGFIYICFLWRTFTHLPNIISGIGGGVEAGYQVNDINTFVHTGFGRGDGKVHQNLKRK